VTYLNVWRAWQEGGRDRRWAARNCVNHRTLLRAGDIRSQLCSHLRCVPARSSGFEASPRTGHGNLYYRLVSRRQLRCTIDVLGL
jgi:hypothetical protein